MAKNLPQMQVIRVLRSDVLMDQGINSRSHIDPTTDPEVKRLSDSIREKSLLQPAVLLPMKQAGEKYAKKKEGYLLVVGFRRQMALDLLQVEEIGYSIAPSSWTLTDAMTANLTENLARKDLTPYETAAMCAAMKDQGLTGAEIAKAVKAQDPDPEGQQTLSEIHVNNMIRAVRELAKPIIDAWKSNHPAASMRKLLKLSAEKDKSVQLAEWHKHVAELEGKGGKVTRKPKDPNARTRPTSDDLLLVAEVIKADKDRLDAEWKKGVLAALLWAATGEKEIPGFKLDTIKEERAAKVAEEKAAEKAAEKAKAEAAAKKAGNAGKGAGAAGAASSA